MKKSGSWAFFKINDMCGWYFYISRYYEYICFKHFI